MAGPVAQGSGADDAEWRAAVNALHEDIATQAGPYAASPEAASTASAASLRSAPSP